MSTGKDNVQARRFATLARMNERIFHASDLAILWTIYQKNTLYTTLRRYMQAGLLFRIHKGLYAIEPLARLDSREMAMKILHEYTYVTTETILSLHGYVSQKPSAITLVSSRSLRIRVNDLSIHSRALAPQFLANPTGVGMAGNVRMASVERAIADMLYFQPTFHFDRPVDWPAVKKMQLDIGYSLTPSRYDTPPT